MITSLNKQKIILLTLLSFCLFSINPNALEPLKGKVSPQQVQDRSGYLDALVIEPSTIRQGASFPDNFYFWEDSGWVVSILTPYIRIFKKKTEKALFLAVSKEGDYHRQHDMAPRPSSKSLSLISEIVLKNRVGVKSDFIEYLHPNISPSLLSAKLAEVNLEKSPTMILSFAEDMEYFLKASILATQYHIPLIIIDETIQREQLDSLIRKLKTEQLFIPIKAVAGFSPFISKERLKVLSIDDLDYLTIKKMTPASISNLIVSDLPTFRYEPFSDPVFFSPYISLMRNAPLYLTGTRNALIAEKKTYDYMKKYHFIPKTITLLADHHKLDTIPADKVIKEDIFSYDEEITVEPFSYPAEGKAIAFGVGRIPFDRLTPLTRLYIRINQKRPSATPKKNDFVMMANLKGSEGENATLLLAETVARATAAELENAGLKGQAFYGIPTNDPNMRNAVYRSDLIIFQGHSSHLFLFERSEIDFLRAPSIFLPLHPFIILQSCNSMDDGEMGFLTGATGLIGSTSRIHSASGSSFIKAYMDRMIYEKASSGEALRDAKNYFLCLIDLKKKRKHKEQAKTRRVMLSFRLWGDPAMHHFDHRLTSLNHQPLKAVSDRSTSVRILTPTRYLPRISTDLYEVKHFPGAQMAGIVSRKKDDNNMIRRINAFYFFQLPVIQPIPIKKPLLPVKTKDIRLTHLKDPFNRWTYVVYYPKKERKNETIPLMLDRN